MNKTIMTVDDSASIRQMVTFTLKNAGYNVIEAKDGKEAITKAEMHKIDMLFVDLNMPIMDGISLIKALRNKNEYKFTPIVMLTTESQEHRKLEGKEAGATGWIIKPFKPDQLIAVIKKVLR